MNFFQPFKIFEVIELMHFQDFPELSQDRKSIIIEYHSGRTSCGEAFRYLHPWKCRKVHEETTESRPLACVTSEDLNCGLAHKHENVERTP